MLCTLDIMPTLAHLAGAKLPDHPVDGKNVWDLIVDKPGAENPHEYYPFSTGGTYINFQTEDEGADRIQAAYGDNFERLVEVKEKYDPTNLFRTNKNITPGPAAS